MASPFLENLKKSVDNGEFNSEAAKKIIEIDKLADEKINAFGLVTDRIEKAGYAESVTEEEAAIVSSKYEEEMEKIKKQDAVNQQLATLIEIEDMVKLSVIDMLTFAKELEEKFGKEFEAKDPMFNDLYLRIQEVKNVFEPTLLEYKHKE
jgi:hypothetical protein